jgi:hypothetical protein
MGRKKKPEESNPFLTDYLDKFILGEPYVLFIYFKIINGQQYEINQFKMDTNFDGNNYNPATIERVFKNSKNSTKSVLMYIINHLNKDFDQIELQTLKIEEATGIKKSSIRNSLIELEALNLIKKRNGRGMTYKYWINPFELFKGKRIDFLIGHDSNFVNQTFTRDIEL